MREVVDPSSQEPRAAGRFPLGGRNFTQQLLRTCLWGSLVGVAGIVVTFVATIGDGDDRMRWIGFGLTAGAVAALIGVSYEIWRAGRKERA